MGSGPENKEETTYMNKTTPCSICGAQTRETTIRYTQEFNGSLFVVTDVPALVCSQCGEEYLSPATVDSLQELVTAGKSRGNASETIEVPVFHFPTH